MGELNDEEMKKLRDMLESWESAQIGIAVFKVLGDVIKWLAAVITAGAILWAVVQSGKP